MQPQQQEESWATDDDESRRKEGSPKLKGNKSDKYDRKKFCRGFLQLFVPTSLFLFTIMILVGVLIEED